MSEQQASPAAAAAASTTNPQRKRGLTAIAVAIAICAVGWGAWHWVHGSNYENTDNAYAAGNVVQITPQVGGTVIEIGADDTDFVKTGQVLVKLDAADARVALEQAEAQLAQTVRDVRSLYSNNASLQAQISLRQADLVKAQADAARAQDDVKRRSALLITGAVGKEEFQHAEADARTSQSVVVAAQAAVQAAREQLQASQTQTDGITPAQHPNVLRASARVRETYLGLERAQLKAPQDGYIAKRGVQLGQRVAAGAPLMTLVALNDMWVDANFKESQLKNLRIGQPAELTADVYGSKVVYHGKVVGLGAGTGAAFSLLPAQNATGNWIKIVQRVPVRIALDPKDLQEHPLRVGLSMDVTVDVRDVSGKTLAGAPRQNPNTSTQIYDEQMQAADVEIKKIIAANLNTTSASAAVATASKAPAKAATSVSLAQ